MLSDSTTGAVEFTGTQVSECSPGSTLTTVFDSNFEESQRVRVGYSGVSGVCVCVLMSVCTYIECTLWCVCNIESVRVCTCALMIVPVCMYVCVCVCVCVCIHTLGDPYTC